MNGPKLSKSERAVVDHTLSWARSYEIVLTAPGRKLLQVITPLGVDQFYTLESDPQARLIFHEPVFFTLSVLAAKGECRAGHQVGDRWEFAWCTPTDLCGSAYHNMYPVLHGLMFPGTRKDGLPVGVTQVTCPDNGWLTFEIEHHYWTPDLWSR